MAESAVKTLKNTLIKCADDGSNVYQALLNLRNTSRPGIMLSPVQLLMSRRTRTVLPIAKSLLSPTTLPDTQANRRQRQIKQRWDRGTIITGTNRSYDVQMDTGNVNRLNRVDLRPAPTPTPSSNTTNSERVVKPVQRYGFE